MVLFTFFLSVQKHITMLQQTITHSVIQSINRSIKPCVQSVRVHAAPCAPMGLNSRPCASMRAHASFSTTGLQLRVWCASHFIRPRRVWVFCEMRNAKVRMGILRNGPRKTLWLVGPFRRLPSTAPTTRAHRNCNFVGLQRRKAANN